MIRKSKFHPNYQLLSPRQSFSFHKLSFLRDNERRELPVFLSDQSEQRVGSREIWPAGQGNIQTMLIVVS